MNLCRKARQLPLRLAAGSYVLNSGLSKWGADETTAKHWEGFALVIDVLLGRTRP